MATRPVIDGISLAPIVRDVRECSFRTVRADLEAALSVALLSIPQALAYSVVVGVRPILALVSMIFGTIVGAFLSSSSHLVVGPNNATALIVQATLTGALSAWQGESQASYVGVLSLLVGLIQIFASLFKLGRLIQFVSHSVVVGYIAGTAFAIIVGQIFPCTGVCCPSSLETLYQKCVYWITHLDESDLATLLVGGFSLVGTMALKRIGWTLAAPLTILVVVSSIVYGFGIQTPLVCSGDFFPYQCFFSAPPLNLNLLNTLLSTAFAIALIGSLEANSIAKSVAVHTGQRLVGNQEVFALGCSNFFISFFGGLPCSGSATRTIFNVENGGKTRFAAMFSGVLVALIILAVGPLIQYVPKASLGAILIASVFRLIDREQIRLCWRATRGDGLVLVATFLSCLFFSMPLALYIGVALSIVLYLQRAAIPKVAEYIYHEQTGILRPTRDEESSVARAIRIVNVEGELFFGAMDLFQYTLRTIAEDDRSTKVIILRLKHAHDLDATAALALKQLKEYLDKRGRSLVVCSLPAHAMNFLENAQLIEFLGRENVISLGGTTSHRPAIERALSRAQELLSRPTPADPVDRSPERATLASVPETIP